MTALRKMVSYNGESRDDVVPVVLQSTEKTVEREVVFWYLIGDGDLDFEVVHWATPPRFLVKLEVRCSPFFILRQRPSRNFGTSSNLNIVSLVLREDRGFRLP